MIRKLRRKFILIAMASVTLVMIFMAVTINAVNFLTTSADLASTLTVIAENQGTVPRIPEEKLGGREPNGHFTMETPFSTRYFVLRYDESGSLINVNMSHIAAVTESDAGTYLSIALKHGEGYGFVGSTYKYYVVKGMDGKYMAVFLDCQQQMRSLSRFLLVSLIVVAACDVLVFLLVLFFSRRAIDPVIESVEKQKQFITDASHELKTPLTVINTSLKLLEMEVGNQKWIDKIRTQVEKLTGLVRDLVTLSRLDEEKPPLNIAAFDISAAVQEVAISFCDYASDRGHSLELDIQPELTFTGDEYAVRQLVSILTENAIKYADPQSVIHLTLAASRKGVVITETNPCAGIDPSQLDRLFDRFYRADKARTNSADGSSFGVGLSIARSITEVHRGTIRAECPEQGVIRFTATLSRLTTHSRKGMGL